MQTLDIHRPEMPDLEFVLLVTALCTSRLTVLNIPSTLRTSMFDRCWVLIHESPPPRRMEERVLDLRPWTELTVEDDRYKFAEYVSDEAKEYLTARYGYKEFVQKPAAAIGTA